MINSAVLALLESLGRPRPVKGFGQSKGLVRPGSSKLLFLGRPKRQVSWMVVASFWMISVLVPIRLYAQQPLDTYLTEASENNPGLQARFKAFEASLERAAQVRSLPNPTLSFGYFIQPVETRVGPQRARFSLSQMFPWFGSLAAKGDAAAAMAQANYLQFIDAREKLMSEVKISYYELWQIREIMELELENLKVLESYKDLATTRIQGGEGKLSSVYRVQMEIEETKTRVEILENQLDQLKSSFNYMLNRETGTPVEIPDTLVAPSDLLTLDSANQHPAVARYRQMEEVANYRLTAARKSSWPSLGLGVDYVIVGERTDMVVPDNGKDAIMPMVSLSLPIWQSQYSAARREARLEQQQYQLEINNATNDLFSKWEVSLFKMQEARDEVKLYQEEIKLARKTLELTVTDYTNGREDFEEILRLQQKIITYGKQKIKAYNNYLDSMASLVYLNYRITENE